MLFRSEFLAFSKGSDDGAPPTDEDMAAVIRRAVGADLPLKIIGHWPWTAGVALVAERYATRRVVLAARKRSSQGARRGR